VAFEGGGRLFTHRAVPGWTTATVGVVAVAATIAAITFLAAPVTADKHAPPRAATSAKHAKFGAKFGAKFSDSGRGGGRTATGPSGPGATGIPAAESGLYPWRLRAPISREVLLSQGPAGSLLIAGGIGANGASVAGAFRLDLGTGALSLVGSLSAATHDAAATVLGGRGLIFGGGTSSPAAMDQDLTSSGISQVLGSLPRARADAAAVTIGSTAYVVGGYDGPSLDPEVLATADGVSFHQVTVLPVAVRYPALATLDGRIYVFGGESSNGQPLSTVQVVNPRTGTAQVIGRLPLPLSGAAAGVLDGVIYVAGGVTGVSSLQPVNEVFAFDRARSTFLRAGSLPVPVANAGAAISTGRLVLVGGETAGGVPSPDVQVVTADRGFGLAGTPGAGSPFYGDKLLIADRGNNRLLLLDDTGSVVWTYPSANSPPPPGGFYFPDDAFFIRRGTAIISNQEENDTIVEIAFPSGRLLFSYGHPRAAGSGPGYLDNPDDAYLLRNGDITVADPMNCRVLVLDPRTSNILTQIGRPGYCVHNPPSGVASPNGDTPLPNGDLLVSEINGSWVDEYTTSGRLVWDARLPIGYPSDPQQIAPNRYLVADYEQPGGIIEFNRAGQILYRYQPASGPGELNHPSLVELLPSGVFLLNDDYNDRVVAIDPVTGALVWQDGETGVAGTAAGLLNAPDGFDILGPGGTTPTHPSTG
jgi:outer membrane protein assembly factor BamB